MTDTDEAFAARERGEIASRIWGLWSAENTPFSVFVVRLDAAAIEAVRPVREALAVAGITAVIPPDFLHITVQSLGNAGEGGLTEEIAALLAEAVAAAMRGVSPFTVRLATVGPFTSGVFAAVADDAAGSLAQIQRTTVNALLAANRVAVRHPDRPYQPHLSLCYFDAPHATRVVLDALAPFRGNDFGPLRVASLDLVRVAGDGSRYPPIETVRRIPFE